MADHIPFITSSATLELAQTLYADSAYFRVPLEHAEKVRESGSSVRLWVDACVDGLDDLGSRSPDPAKNRKRSQWYSCTCEFPGFERIADPGFQARPDKQIVRRFVKAALDRCLQEKPALISVPQLPLHSDTSRNKINRALADATGHWRATARYPGRLVLPVILTDQQQTTKARTPRIEQAARNYEDSDAAGFWMVDSSLEDDSGSETLRAARFPGLLAMHEELAERVQTDLKIGGPYWGLNLALWARRLIDYPAVGVGTGYRYFLSGGIATSPSARMPIPPLLRRARASSELKQWLDGVLAAVPKTESAHDAFSSLKRHFTMDGDRGRLLIAKFYKEWFNGLASHPPAGRSMALFQELSAAYALGKSMLMNLPLPSVEGTAKKPEAVAAQLMMCCL